MGYLISSGEVGNIVLNQLQEQRKLISEKWGKLGLLEGLQGHIKDEIAALYESQPSWLLHGKPEKKKFSEFLGIKP